MTCRYKLTFAGASTPTAIIAGPTGKPREAAQPPDSTTPGRRGGGVEPVLDLGLDRLDLVFLRSELQRPAPLIARFDKPPDAPVRIAEMVVDRRVLRHQLDRLFELFDRRLVVAHPEMRPAQAIDDVAVIGTQLDRLVDHLHALIQVLAAVDPRIAEIIEHHRLIWFELQRLLQIGLGLLPLT